MDKDYLILKRASASRSPGEWNDDDYDVLADRVVVGRILKVHAASVGSPWMWTRAFGHHEDRTPTHGYEATREAAMRSPTVAEGVKSCPFSKVPKKGANRQAQQTAASLLSIEDWGLGIR
jgi:hypothetical protein